jgi:hypothetical protein
VLPRDKLYAVFGGFPSKKEILACQEKLGSLVCGPKVGDPVSTTGPKAVTLEFCFIQLHSTISH